MKAKNLTGAIFGRLTVLERQGSNKLRHALWLCECKCGEYKVISSQDLLSGKTKSCGCLRKEVAKVSNETHKMTNSKIYAIWRGMKRRCYCEINENFKYYGGRGITVCEEWKNDFKPFYDYVSKLPHFGEEGYSLDRINNNGNYEPGNVRWATAKEQANNKRKTYNKKR